MTPKERDEYINQRIFFWRQTLKIPKDIDIKIKYATHRDDDEERKYATISRDMLPYSKCSMEIYDEVFASKNFEKDADEAICHELLHLATYPLIAYANNMFTEDVGKQKHLEDLEEALVTSLERSFTELAGRVKCKRLRKSE